MQAAEAIKLIAGAGESLSGRLVMFDAKAAEWRSVRVKRDAGCAVCATRADSAAGR
jgi:adenylyltransferase/sulfurtransferase